MSFSSEKHVSEELSDPELESEAASTAEPGADGLASLWAEPASTVLATNSVCEVPRAAGTAAGWPAPSWPPPGHLPNQTS